MGTAARIRSYRVRAGKSAAGVAQALGLNDAWYEDLEQRDDELVSTLTLFQAMELAALLNVRLRDLVEEGAWTGEEIPLISLPSRIEAHLARSGSTIAELEEEVGWDLRDFLESPLTVAAESPIRFLQALAGRLGINWLAFVPDSDAVG